MRATTLLRVGPRTARWVAASLLDRQGAGSRPPHRISPPVVAGAYLDELVGATWIITQTNPSDDELGRMTADLDAAIEQWDERGWLAEPASYHRDPTPLAAHEVSFRPATWGRRWQYEHVSFQSGFAPRPDEPGAAHWGVGDVVHGAVLRHGDGTQHPWIVLLHGYGMGHAGLDIVGFKANHLHHDLGLNVMIPAMPRHGPRRHHHTAGLASLDIVHTVHNLSQAVWDVRRIVRWIRSTTGQPVGLMGLSLGGYMTSMVASLEDVDLAIAGIPVVDLGRLIQNHAPRPVRTKARRAGLFGNKATAAISLVSPLSVEPRVPHDRRFIFAALGDRMTTPEQADVLWEHWTRPPIHWYHGGHVGFIWTPAVRRFIDDALVDSGFASRAPQAPKRQAG